MHLRFICTFQAEIDAAVAELLKLKEEYKKLTGTDAPSSGSGPARKEKEKKPTIKSIEHEQAKGGDASSDSKKQTR